MKLNTQNKGKLIHEPTTVNTIHRSLIKKKENIQGLNQVLGQATEGTIQSSWGQGWGAGSPCIPPTDLGWVQPTLPDLGSNSHWSPPTDLGSSSSRRRRRGRGTLGTKKKDENKGKGNEMTSRRRWRRGVATWIEREAARRREGGGRRDAAARGGALNVSDVRSRATPVLARCTLQVEIFLSPVGRRGSGRDPLARAGSQMRIWTSLGRIPRVAWFWAGSMPIHTHPNEA